MIFVIVQKLNKIRVNKICEIRGENKIMLTLSGKIEFVKYLKEKFHGKNLTCIEFFNVVECALNFGVVENIDFADDKVSVWGGEIGVFWINLNDIININYKPDDEDACLLIEAKNNVKVQFTVE